MRQFARCCTIFSVLCFGESNSMTSFSLSLKQPKLCMCLHRGAWIIENKHFLHTGTHPGQCSPHLGSHVSATVFSHRKCNPTITSTTCAIGTSNSSSPLFGPITLRNLRLEKSEEYLPRMLEDILQANPLVGINLETHRV